MLQSFKAILRPDGTIQLQEPLRISKDLHAIVTLLDEHVEPVVSEEALLSEQALADDWEKGEEDVAWAFLQKAK